MGPSRLPLEAVVHHEGRTLARCLIRRGRYVIGHDRKNEIVAEADSVSSKHARLTVSSDEHFFLEDLGSANGTVVNGVAIDTLTPLTLDCEIRLGQVTLAFERGGLPASIFLQLPEGFLRSSRYTVGQVIVQGRTSTIFEARDNDLRRTVAMKVLKPETQADPLQVLAFIRETQIAAQLPHIGVLPVYDFGLDPEIGLFSATRFMEGESLANLLTGLTSGESASPHASLYALMQIFLKTCSTVAFAHSRGVVHGALRPESIVFGRHGEVFVDHWGYASLAPPIETDKPEVTAPSRQASPPLSRYTAPEQLEQTESANPRADVYALGAILFQLLTLRHFTPGESDEELQAHLRAPILAPPDAFAAQPAPAHIPGGHWPERLVLACVRALSAEPADRFADASDLKKEISAWMEGAMTGGETPKGWKLTSLLGRHRS